MGNSRADGLYYNQDRKHGKTMGTLDVAEVTGLLRAWSQGDQSAMEKLAPLVDRELRRIARRHMARQRAGHVLQTTALVNEAYVRLIDAAKAEWRDRAHFFAVCAKIMRRILVDLERANRAAKRGEGLALLPLDELLVVAPERNPDLVALDDAMLSLARIDPRKCDVVEMRFFGGLSVEETAEVLRVSPETVKRDWRLAKVWLLRELCGSAPDDA
ncbi:MAG: sigma-70 family RNA polymerase sigma factor [Bryobacterales bacterium]|nr:sigma-70 family RNA polymerase sigma factor [Bryobacterales bacterium]MEB2362267.1 sigma-70 family RNA polymerase sigma factor [Bryobacterales bacterium]